jgi:hypothetical protein
MAATACVGGIGLTALLAREVLRLQARSARGTIGKPLGEAVHLADRAYKRKYGNPIELLLLGDSIAAGLGADKPSHTLGAQLAKRLARRTQRSVRLHTAAHVGAKTSMLRAQLAGLPSGHAAAVADVAVIVVGGNDVTHRVKTTTFKQQLAEVVDTLQRRGTRVAVGTCPTSARSRHCRSRCAPSRASPPDSSPRAARCGHPARGARGLPGRRGGTVLRHAAGPDVRDRQVPPLQCRIPPYGQGAPAEHPRGPRPRDGPALRPPPAGADHRWADHWRADHWRADHWAG